jgi:hypothetical protein
MSFQVVLFLDLSLNQILGLVVLLASRSSCSSGNFDNVNALQWTSASRGDAHSGKEVNAGTYSQYSKKLEQFLLSFLAFFFLGIFLCIWFV